MQTDLEALSELILRVYDAGLQPTAWERVMDELAQRLGGASFVFSAIDRNAGPLLYVATQQDSAAAQRIPRDYGTVQRNAIYAAMPRLPVGELTPRHRVQSDADYFASDLYNDVFRPQRLAHRALACLKRSDQLIVPLGILRPQPLENFDEPQTRLLRAVLPHVGRAVETYAQLSAPQPSAPLNRAALEQLPMSVLFVDAHGRAQAVNCAAERLLRLGDGLLLRHGELAAWRADETPLLRKALAQAGQGISAGMLMLQRRGGRRPYLLSASPLGREVAPEWFETTQGALLLVRDLASEEALDPRHLRSLFRLTAREADLALALMRGARLEAHAETRGISPNTAKAQLQAIFAKTGTSRQSELVRLVSSIAGLAPENMA